MSLSLGTTGAEASREASVSAITTKVAYGGATAAGASGAAGWIFSLHLNDIGIIAGIVIGVATFGVNWYYRWRDNERKQALFNREYVRRKHRYHRPKIEKVLDEEEQSVWLEHEK
jgi:hypothetical protein